MKCIIVRKTESFTETQALLKIFVLKSAGTRCEIHKSERFPNLIFMVKIKGEKPFFSHGCSAIGDRRLYIYSRSRMMLYSYVTPEGQVSPRQPITNSLLMR